MKHLTNDELEELQIRLQECADMLNPNDSTLVELSNEGNEDAITLQLLAIKAMSELARRMNQTRKRAIKSNNN